MNSRHIALSLETHSSRYGKLEGCVLTKVMNVIKVECNLTSDRCLLSSALCHLVSKRNPNRTAKFSKFRGRMQSASMNTCIKFSFEEHVN